MDEQRHPRVAGALGVTGMYHIIREVRQEWGEIVGRELDFL
jgi:hypothetical protein